MATMTINPLPTGKITLELELVVRDKEIPANGARYDWVARPIAPATALVTSEQFESDKYFKTIAETVANAREYFGIAEES